MNTLRRNLTTIVLLTAAGFCFCKGLAGLVSNSAQASVAPKPSKRLVTTPIQDLRVGMRVVGRNPLAEDAQRDLPQPEPATWRLVRVRMEHKPGEFVDAELLRPLEWIEASGAAVGEEIWLELPEMFVAGEAEVLAIEPCPPIKSGTNPIVTGTFQHLAESVVDVHVDGSRDPIGCTAEHPIWSETRRDFIPAARLEIGERVLTAFGYSARITSIVPRAGPRTVYGLEVYGEHVYHVGEAGLLAHNASSRTPRSVVQFHKHHTMPREILKTLPPDVANNPLVRGRAGAPNRWKIPVDLHKQIHKGAGGGAYNEAFKARIRAIGRDPTVDDVLKIRDELVKQFGVEGYRP